MDSRGMLLRKYLLPQKNITFAEQLFTSARSTRSNKGLRVPD